MKTTEAIILAGGFGTRLKHIVSDVPKPMADINGEPFLSFLLRKLTKAGIQHVIFSTGYLHEKIEAYFGHSFENLHITYSQETDPLGTGGAIRFALHKAKTDNVLVLNGDTLFDIDFRQFEDFYQQKETMLAVALRKEKDVSRYGAVEIDDTAKIVGFAEKNTTIGEGFINGGIYLLNKKLFENKNLPKNFSFEKEILEKEYVNNDFYGLPFDGYFIDIGVPEDYARAQNEFLMLFQENALLLDRDGVINRQIVGGYVTQPEEFEFLPNVLEALALLAEKFEHIFIVTNQQGIGKGVFSKTDLEKIHQNMLAEITKSGGRIDKIYFSPHLESENNPNRKPNIGMALQAKRDFPELDFSQSIMLGDSLGDMQFGKNAGMKTVLLNQKITKENSTLVDEVFSDLLAFARSV